MTVEFRSDGTATQTTVYEGEIITDNFTYTTSGNQITIIDEFGDEEAALVLIDGQVLLLVTRLIRVLQFV